MQSLSDARLELRDLRMELERRDNALREAEISRKALQAEVNNLKAVIDDEDDDEDEDEVSLNAQKEIIISRDQVKKCGKIKSKMLQKSLMSLVRKIQ